jgi:hypothetical protein
VRAVCAVAPLALATSACGGKPDAVAKTLAQPSEHVELRGTVTAGAARGRFTASGDFENDPDRGTMTMRIGGATVREVITPGRIYLQSRLFGTRHWRAVDTGSAAPVQTPAQILRVLAAGTRYPFSVAGGLVRRVRVRTSAVSMTVILSRFGEPIDVQIPSTGGK